MNRTFKTLLLWIIMIALPVQAMAAVMKASCSSSHHAMQTHGIAFHQPAPVHMHEGYGRHDGRVGHDAMPASHLHSDHAAATPELPGVDFPKAHGNQSAESDDHATCSACASCCVGAAAPPSVHVKTPDFSTYVKSAVASTSPLAGFIPAGLERPPRFFPA